LMERPVHPFAATLSQMASNGFASLNEQQRWEWHADVYAFNQVMLGRKDSPADPRHLWFDAARVEIAVQYYRAKLDPREAQRRVRSNDSQREGRALVNRWAKRHGFETIEAFAEARGIDPTAATVMAGCELVIEKAKLRPQVEGFKTAGADPGIAEPATAQRAASSGAEFRIDPVAPKSDAATPEAPAEKSSVRKRAKRRSNGLAAQKPLIMPIVGGRARNDPAWSPNSAAASTLKSQRRPKLRVAGGSPEDAESRRARPLAQKSQKRAG
jgi:hypothetical protein